MTNVLPSFNAAAQIVAARRVAQIDQQRISDLGAYRARVARDAHSAYDAAWRRLLDTDPYLDAIQLANAVEPLDPPERPDPHAEQQAAWRRRAQGNQPPPARLDETTFDHCITRARAAIRGGTP